MLNQRTDDTTTIPEFTYYDKGMTDCNMPHGVQSIGKYAFAKNNLTNVNLDSVTSIGGYAFFCNKLIEIHFPNAVSIGQFAFDNNKLQTISIPSGIRTIARYTF
jgi:hypothetical protein